jgi:hypothetical protein
MLEYVYESLESPESLEFVSGCPTSAAPTAPMAAAAPLGSLAELEVPGRAAVAGAFRVRAAAPSPGSLAVPAADAPPTAASPPPGAPPSSPTSPDSPPALGALAAGRFPQRSVSLPHCPPDHRLQDGVPARVPRRHVPAALVDAGLLAVALLLGHPEPLGKAQELHEVRVRVLLEGAPVALVVLLA